MRELLSPLRTSETEYGYSYWTMNDRTKIVSPVLSIEGAAKAMAQYARSTDDHEAPGVATPAARMGLAHGYFPLLRRQTRPVGEGLSSHIDLIGVATHNPPEKHIAQQPDDLIACGVRGAELWLPGDRDITAGEANYVLGAINTIQREINDLNRG